MLRTSSASAHRANSAALRRPVSARPFEGRRHLRGHRRVGLTSFNRQAGVSRRRANYRHERARQHCGGERINLCLAGEALSLQCVPSNRGSDVAGERARLTRLAGPSPGFKCTRPLSASSRH